MDRIFIIVAKLIAYPVLLIFAFVTLFRGGVGYLLGSHSDFAIVAAIALGLFGGLFLVYLAVKAVQNILGDINKPLKLTNVVNQQNAQAGGDIVAGNKTQTEEV